MSKQPKISNLAKNAVKNAKNYVKTVENYVKTAENRLNSLKMMSKEPKNDDKKCQTWCQNC